MRLVLKKIFRNSLSLHFLCDWAWHKTSLHNFSFSLLVEIEVDTLTLRTSLSFYLYWGWWNFKNYTFCLLKLRFHTHFKNFTFSLIVDKTTCTFIKRNFESKIDTHLKNFTFFLFAETEVGYPVQSHTPE